MEREKIHKKIQKALLKRALGYDCSEIIEEYAMNGDDMTMVKRKVTTKNVPPDISAAKVLLENFADNEVADLTMLSDAQLECEKQRLLALLKEKSKIETS